MKSILEFQQAFKTSQKISMLTCYDFWTAKILNQSKIDCLLVGDSVAMVMHGFESPISATLPMMRTHIEAVRRGAPDKFIIGDMPFMSFRKDMVTGLEAGESLIRSGANAVKLEGVKGHEELIGRLVDSGIPVMGHLGLTPQSVNAFGGFKVQGRNEIQAKAIGDEAKKLQALGCFAIVLECVPSALARSITSSLQVPTIGIGAGPDTSGQVLVLQDMLGVNKDFHPKFLRNYASLEEDIHQAIFKYTDDVGSGRFPAIKESYE